MNTLPKTYEEWRAAQATLSSYMSVPEQLSVMRSLVSSFPRLGYPRSKTTTDFVQPSIGNPVSIVLDSVDWIAPHVVLSIGKGDGSAWVGGIYQVSSVVSATLTVTMKRLDGGTLMPSSTDGVIIPLDSLCAICAFIPDGNNTAASTPHNTKATLSNSNVTVRWDQVDVTYADEIIVAWGPGDGPNSTCSNGTYINIPSSDVSCSIRLPDYGYYWVEVYARLNGKLGAVSSESPIWIQYKATTLPTNVTASLNGAYLVLHWDTLADSSASVVVEYWESSQTQRYRCTAEAGSSSASMLLPDSGKWDYRLASQNASGNQSEWSASASVNYLGTETPSNVSFTVDGNILTAAWTNPKFTDEIILDWYKAETEGGSAIERGTTSALSRNGDSSLMLSLAPGYYFCRVWNYYNGTWSATAEPESGTWVHVSEATTPSGVTASVSMFGVTLSWNVINDANEIQIEYWLNVGDGITPVKSSQKINGASSTVKIMVTTTGDYTYRIGSRKNTGSIQWSATGTFIIVGPTQPANVTGAWASGVATISWDSLIANPTVYMFEVQVDTNSTDSAESYSTIAYPAKHYTSLTNNQASGNSYTYRIRTVDMFGNVSAWSSTTISS